jgi:hypothetical protein
MKDDNFEYVEATHENLDPIFGEELAGSLIEFLDEVSEPEQFVVIDDGTLDTVIRATCCGRSYRFNYQMDEAAGDFDEDEETDPDKHYDNWLGNHIDNLREEHECNGAA